MMLQHHWQALFGIPYSVLFPSTFHSPLLPCWVFSLNRRSNRTAGWIRYTAKLLLSLARHPHLGKSVVIPTSCQGWSRRRNQHLVVEEEGARQDQVQKIKSNRNIEASVFRYKVGVPGRSVVEKRWRPVEK